jgi:transcriptional regulator with XRE-family HTH domain
MKDFGKRLKYYRKQAGFTQEQLAEKLGISNTQYQNYEQGISYPLMDKFIVLCQVINVPADCLLSDKARVFQDYSSTALFQEFRDMSDDESKAINFAFLKMAEYKKKLDEPKD